MMSPLREVSYFEISTRPLDDGTTTLKQTLLIYVVSQVL